MPVLAALGFPPAVSRFIFYNTRHKNKAGLGIVILFTSFTFTVFHVREVKNVETFELFESF